MFFEAPNANVAADYSAATKKFKSQAVILGVGLTMIMIASCLTLPLLVQALPELAQWPLVKSLVSFLALFIITYSLIACALLAIQVLMTAHTFVKWANYGK